MERKVWEFWDSASADDMVDVRMSNRFVDGPTHMEEIV